jgi:hypothetical protein
MGLVFFLPQFVRHLDSKSGHRVHQYPKSDKRLGAKAPHSFEISFNNEIVAQKIERKTHAG